MADDKWTSRFSRDPADETPEPENRPDTEDQKEPSREEMPEPTGPQPEFEALEPVPDRTSAAPPPEAAPRRVFAGTGISWAFIFGTLLTVAIIVLALQNTDPVPVRLYFWDLEAPLIIVMLVTALAAIVVDQLIGMIIRRRRRRQLEEREELKRLRAQTGGRIE